MAFVDAQLHRVGYSGFLAINIANALLRQRRNQRRVQLMLVMRANFVV